MMIMIIMIYDQIWEFLCYVRRFKSEAVIEVEAYPFYCTKLIYPIYRTDCKSVHYICIPISVE